MERTLPIFPLRLVLFPGAPQPLHIFEPRYRQLLADCTAGEPRFGISCVFSETGDSDPEPGDVGCIALIRARHDLSDGRATIVTMGEERYTLVEWLDSDRLYRVARVRLFDDEDAPSTESALLAGRVETGFRRYVALVGALHELFAETPPLPSDPKQLSFLISAAVELALDVKQELLALRSTTARLERLRRLLSDTEEMVATRLPARFRARRN